ncbi:DUF4133 domain-containing protein [Olivibacter domesticus]|uniref:DUF4133 domain-containing protein n=1 Tax=Olivibacter domesticus TaxID=407022 RepID=A0A1H7I9R4_OLID1|nr:DUF4133 domain-containing protein [Olivibacter domesticus]SEK59236.1 protein of unknown function [Olivibacter domesticus]
MACIYRINKGVNRPVEFKGLKAQYIWYLGGGVMVLLIIYAGLYFMAVNQYLCLVLIGALGTGLVVKVYELSNKYGEHGMMKAIAKKSVPKLIKCNSRKVFIEFSKKVILKRQK